ncbi:pumilio/PUF RNA binding protein 7 [Strigomonas culicis]|uniref:Pumilio/PUF RNA binding protein 7 n=1 Tax=Strigomonas culicis TaxID=28005 RepID=S9V9M2_9TRYP|nr:pumilio/PUF RNA binding protein 7 [Strigomonas culicis]|eukprot:EPY23666.1 pumilio/PUF RNA binding protein 7 [Strigomonas culicis]
MTLLDQCDNLQRVQMLYNVRRKLLDLCTSAVGNTIVQHMLEKLPARQKKEIAEMLVLNVEADEVKRLCEHPSGNHVVQKMMEIPVCAEAIKANFLPYAATIARNDYGMRVVAKYVQSVEGGWLDMLRLLFPTLTFDAENMDLFDAELSETDAAVIDKEVRAILQGTSDPMVLKALLHHVLVPVAIKDAICCHLAEYAADYLLVPEAAEKAEEGTGEQKKKAEAKQADEESFDVPDFGTAASPNARRKEAAGPRARHVHLFVAAFDSCDDAQRAILWESLQAQPELLFALVSEKALVSIAVAAAKNYATSRAALAEVLFHEAADPKSKARLSVVAVAEHPVRTLLLRALLEVDAALLSKARQTELCEAALALSQSATASPVLQRLVATDADGHCAKRIYDNVKKHMAELVNHTSASYLLQALLQAYNEEVRSALIKDLMKVFEDLHKLTSYAQGSRVFQKMLTYAPDAVISRVVKKLIAKAGEEESEVDEEEAEEAKKTEEAEQKLTPKERRELNKARHFDIASHAIVSYALHAQACYVITTLLQEVRTRHMEKERKLLMNELKPHVFSLATSPWAGRVVLDTMLQHGGSKELADAMRNVVFLKAEAWLSEVSAERKKVGGMDPTMRQMLKRQRDDIQEGRTPAPESQSEGEASAGSGGKHKN